MPYNFNKDEQLSHQCNSRIIVAYLLSSRIHSSKYWRTSQTTHRVITWNRDIIKSICIPTTVLTLIALRYKLMMTRYPITLLLIRFLIYWRQDKNASTKSLRLIRLKLWIWVHYNILSVKRFSLKHNCWKNIWGCENNLGLRQESPVSCDTNF